jgi:segregation and condensation protein A
VNSPFQPVLDFEATSVVEPEGEALIIELDGYEGPLHVLLALARAQKVDLLKLSVTRLVDQYLAFVREARRARFALAADYLVMAAWLAFLKSRLLLPRAERPPEDEGPAELVAERLAFRIAKLDAMRRAVEALQARPILKRDVFMRGDPETVSVVSHHRLDGDLHDLMAAYLQHRTRGEDRSYHPPTVNAYRLDDARDRLRLMLPELTDWIGLSRVAPAERAVGPARSSYVASTLSASLELVKAGEMEARQRAAFEEVYLRAAAPAL